MGFFSGVTKVQITLSLMKRYALIFLVVFFLAPVQTVFARTCNLEIDFTYVIPASLGKNVAGYRVFKDGIEVCAVANPGARSFDCGFESESGSYDFTMAAYYDDQSLGPLSEKYPFVIEEEASSSVGGPTTAESGGGSEESGGGTEETAGGTEESGGGTKDTAGSTEESGGGTEETAGTTEESGGGTKDTAGSTEESEGGAEETGGGSEGTESLAGTIGTGEDNPFNWVAPKNKGNGVSKKSRLMTVQSIVKNYVLKSEKEK